MAELMEVVRNGEHCDGWTETRRFPDFGRDRDGEVVIRLTFDAGDRSIRFTRRELEGNCDQWAFDDVDQFCRRRYSELVEDHLVDRQSRSMRRQLLEATRAGVGPDLLSDMQQNLRDFEDHARRYHRDDRAVFSIPTRLGEPLSAVETVNWSFTTAVEMLPMPEPDAGRAQEMHRLLNEAYEDIRRGAFIDFSLVVNPGDRMVYVGPDVLVGFDGTDFGTPGAQEKGLALLKANLTPAQLTEYETRQHFHVIGCDTKSRYRIRHGRQMNIDVINNNGARTHGLCFLPQGNLVAGDCLLAQKIALETMEAEALKIANRLP